MDEIKKQYELALKQASEEEAKLQVQAAKAASMQDKVGNKDEKGGGDHCRETQSQEDRRSLGYQKCHYGGGGSDRQPSGQEGRGEQTLSS